MKLSNQNQALIDLPVLLIFFARPEQLSKVFEQVKKVKPSKLFLYQDGPRLNRPDDVENINKCRKIVEDIDWECEIHKKYQQKNIGCDPSEFIAQKWMFETEEYGIVLEDDDVPSLSFFPFCKELLEKYKNDERINMICGMNHLGELTDNPNSYIFTVSGSIWGWASWKRVIEKWEEHYDFINDPNVLNLLKIKLGEKDFKSYYKTCLKHFNSGKAHYESILGSSLYLNSRLNIVPTKNMISNIGIGFDTTHSADSISKLPKGIRRVLFMKTHEIEFPIKHPKYIIENVEYKKKIDCIMGNNFPVNAYRKIESILYRIKSGDFKSVRKGLLRRLGL
jgi:hypothetical protein